MQRAYRFFPYLFHQAAAIAQKSDIFVTYRHSRTKILVAINQLREVSMKKARNSDYKLQYLRMRLAAPFFDDFSRRSHGVRRSGNFQRHRKTQKYGSEYRW
jgi:hypothetical protein